MSKAFVMRMRFFSFLFLISLVLAQPLCADLPFRNHRYDAFKVLSVNKDNIVFIGNSITNMHEWWEAFDNPNVLNRGNSGAVSDETVANLESVLSGQPAKVFLMIGTNDLGVSPTKAGAHHLIDNVRTILSRFKKESPRTEIYVQSILPSGQRDLKLQRYSNDSIRKICLAEGATYVDLWDKLISVSQNNTNTLDKLHLSATGYKIWCETVAPYVGSSSTYPANTTNRYNGLGGSNGMRVSHFAMHPIKDGDILLIGDEMVHGGEWHELLHSGKVRGRGVGWGYPGLNMSGVLSAIPEIFYKSAHHGTAGKVFLYAGAADANGSESLSALASRYRQLVQKIKECSPGSEVYLQALLPTSNANTNTNRVKPFNDSIRAIAAAQGCTFVDDYTPLASGNVGKGDYFMGNYVSGKGYAKLSQVLAPHMGEDVTPTTDAQASQAYSLFTARTGVATALDKAASVKIGSGVAEYPEEKARPLLDEVEDAYQLLGDETVTLSSLSAKATSLGNKVTAVLPYINLPQPSAGGEDKYYTFVSVLRGNRMLTSRGADTLLIGSETHRFATGMWRFVTRGDGRWNIRNREDGSYINPSAAFNTALSTSTSEPQNGWEVSYSNTPGLFIVKSGNVQLNQTQSGLNYAIYNWSAGGSGNDRADLGCQFQIAEAGEPFTPPSIDHPLVAMTDIALTGLEAYAVPEDLARLMLSAGSGTLVIDFTPKSNYASASMIVASANASGDQYFGVAVRESGTKYGVHYVGDNNKEGYYTQQGVNLTNKRTRIIITMDEESESYKYYLNGTFQRSVSGLGDYGYRIFGNVPGVSGLYLGGFPLSNGTLKNPLRGTIHSLRFWDSVLPDNLLSDMQYENIIPTGIRPVKRGGSAGDDAVYNTMGQRIAHPQKGEIYIQNGKKRLAK